MSISGKSQAPAFFKTPFTPAYWKLAGGEIKKINIMAVASLFIALDIIVGYLIIPVGENLRISFSFLITSLSSLICGPVVAIVSGFVRDILGFLIRPDSGFFFGYTLTAMLSGLIYALFFYRARITIVRVALCKLTINLGVNILIGSIWSAMLYGKGYYYYLAKSVVKNSIMLPIEIIMLILFFRFMLPLLAKNRMVAEQPTKNIPII